MMPSEIHGLGLTIPPTQDELPYDDGVPMESQRHNQQMGLLIDALLPWLDQREDGFVGGNMFVYYSMRQVRNQDFRGPDFFAVLGVPKKERKSWVCWEEEKTPDLVIELLSDSTREVDKGEKKQIYQNQLHVSEYFWYDPFDSNDFSGFRLQGSVYQDIPFTASGKLISQVLDLALVRWQGSYKGTEAVWLRWANLNGRLLLTYEEQEHQQAEQERQRAEQERQRAEQERQRADRAEAQVLQIARSLLQLGMEEEQIARTTALSIEQIRALNAES